MSFVRRDDDSDLYIYESSAGPGDVTVCSACPLLPAKDLVSPFYGWTTSNLSAMLGHVADHRAAGHRVPADLEAVLRDEWSDPR